jgi:chitin deacetylase
MRTLLSRPSLLALAALGAATSGVSLVAAAGLPHAAGARLALTGVSWAALAALLGHLFLPGVDLPWRVVRRAPGERAVALTFDDGPHPATTPALLEALREAGVHATFFVVGEAVERWPELALRIAAEGHAVGNHTQRHRLLLFRTAAELAEEIAGCQRALARLGLEPRLFRPPHGCRPLGLHRLLGRHRLKLCAWQDALGDSDHPDASTVLARALALAREGRILRLKDGPGAGGRTLSALPWILKAYRARGYRFVTLDEPADAGRQQMRGSASP